MTARFLVQDRFQLTGRGTVVTGLLVDGVVHNGDTLRVEETGAQVRISFVDFHTRQTPEGAMLSLRLHPEDAAVVTPGSVLISPPEA